VREPHWTGSASEELGEDLVVPTVRLQMPGFAPESQVYVTHRYYEMPHGSVGVMSGGVSCVNGISR
jgi:hypothetical protein